MVKYHILAFTLALREAFRPKVTVVGPSKTLEYAPLAKARSCRTSIILIVLSVVPEYVKSIVHINSSVIDLAGDKNEK